MISTVSPTLDVRTGATGATICCRNCGHALARAGSPWKSSAIVHELSTDWPRSQVEGSTAATIVRLFVCRGCGTLLDSETVLPGEPFLEDIVNV